MKWIKLLLSLSLVTMFFGCIISEEIETKIQLNADGKTASAVIEYKNISSGEAEPADVQKDFNNLIEDWQGDQYLLDRAEEGLFIKNREVFIRDGKIVGRVTGIMKDVDKLYSFWVSHNERIMIFETESDNDYELVETNGKILKTDKNTLIIWPDTASELRWQQRLTKLPGSFEKNQKPMVKILQDYLNK